jgi:hypothetical protein
MGFDPSSPPRPDLATHPGSPTPHRRRRWPWVVAAVVAVNLGVGVLLVTRSHSDVPGQIAGLPRLRTESARSFEHLIASFDIGGLSLRGAMYGSGDQPQLVLERFVGSDDPFQGVPIETVLGQADAGLGGSFGGSGDLDTAATVSETRDGVEYACAPFHGSSFPGAGDVSVICIFSGHASGVVFDLRTAEVSTALDDAEAAYHAVLDAA